MHPATIRHSCPVRNGAFYYFHRCIHAGVPLLTPCHKSVFTPGANGDARCRGSFFLSN